MFLTPLHSTTQQSQVVSAISEFSTTLFKAVSAENGLTENVCMSPFSIAAVLLMTYVGAKGNTAAQLRNSLNLARFSDEVIDSAMGNLIRGIKGDGNLTLENVNQLYVAKQYQLLETFQSRLKNHFGAQAKSVDFGTDETRVKINKRVEKFTKNNIKNILPKGSIGALTRLVLVNALYFKGNWMEKFNPSLTKQEPFFLNSKDARINTPMMHISGEFRTGNINSLDARLIELPYVGRKLSMFIILPNKIDGLTELESKMSNTFLNEIDSMLIDSTVDVAIPKFKIEADVPVKEILIQMGIADLFNIDTANLSGVSGSNNLYVSDIFHKAAIEVNEEGSEAAAASAVVFVHRKARITPERVPPFVVNHPALFLIKDNQTKLVLFIGRLANPSAA